MARSLPKVPIAALIIALVILAVGGIFLVKQRSNTLPGADNNTTAEDGTEFTGPTNQELSDTESHKENLSQTNRESSPTTGSKRGVSVVITSANANEVRGFVSGVVEDNGACTATFTQRDKSFTKSSTGAADASTTICGVIRLSRADFSSSGTWSVTLNYDSSTSQGKSSAATIEVP